ncbi:hypothetical protein VTJ83DRAFT_360 [Remersonia thermophila]|uniref:Telomere-associated protein Rif1 N-terminal domain-containing protein n=1 Tax=Remersonia thermophila TaxID=72144 RepID=A0ABR4DN80_9PEZI
MSSPVVLSCFLSSLPERPPTPPREAQHDGTSTTRPPLACVDAGLNIHTPPGFQSPSSSVAASTSKRRKKVGFSAQAEYKEPPVYADGVQHPTPVSLPRSASKPVKSILKPTVHSPNILAPTAANGDLADSPVNLATMLESTLQQLAGGDRDSKLDAYLMMTRAWKASNNLPDRVALQEKMSLFTQFMQRDILAKTPEGNVDSSLVNHALTLLNTFLHFPAIASTISNDFAVFIIEHCIRCFGDPTTPKDTARRLMQVISLQNFSAKVMTSDRVGRLVSSLRSIEEHIQGKSIVLSRVLIYRKLVQQSKQLMIIHSDWLVDLFTDMLSHLKDIRSAAVALGLEAAYSIGHEKQLARKVMELLNTSHEDRRYLQYYEERLAFMTKDKHESAVVPQIWSVITLLLRIRLDKWEHARPWLQIIQNCFNSPDFPTKIAANQAWGRLVYLMHFEEQGFLKNLATLSAPLVSQLRRKGSGKTSEELRRAVLGGICNFFYYSFRPNAPSTHLDTYWDASVRPVFAKLLDPAAETAEDNLRQASTILAGLLDCTTPRMWKVDRIVDPAFVKPEELPAVDSKWVRRNAGRVFSVMEPILSREFVALSRPDSTARRLWQSLVSSVASAAAKEIKVSRDTTVFVTEALAVLDKLWKRGLAGEGKGGATDFLLATQAYVDTMVTLLGLLPFTEKTGKHQPSTKVPLSTLFSLLSNAPPGVPDDKEFADFFARVFAPFFASKGAKAKIDLALELMSTIPMEISRPYGMWLLVAQNISGWLEPDQHSHRSTSTGGETPIGHEYRDIVKVLERGIRSTPNLPPKHWESLFYATFERVREETGDAGVAIVIIEPLAKVLADLFAASGSVEASAACVKYVTELVSVATQPRDRQAVDAARKRLWGTSLAGSRSASFDTFDNLYKAVNEVLAHLYAHSDPIDSDSAVQLFKEIGGFFDRCNRQLFLRAMMSLQDGLLVWFQDGNRLLGGQTPSVLAAMKLVWDKLSNLVSDMEHPEQQLQSLERFFCASLASCHRSIVNSAISLWNRLAASVDHLEYPEELKAALMQMQAHADIMLPGLDASSVECAGQQLSFVDSFDDLSLPMPPLHSSSRRATPVPALASRPGTGHGEKPSGDQIVSFNQRSTRSRARHDDSQIQFQPIEPSVPSSPLESQVLTEHQKEVRDRQRENSLLFPEIGSSPGPKGTRQNAPVGPRTRQATTPERQRRFDDYISSTPTPRRGQVTVMTENDLTDPPSSPPEVRGNPLAAEIRSRSVSHSILDEWQFSSSPVSGSPNPSRQQAVVPDPTSRRGWISVVHLPEVVDEAEVPSSPMNAGETTLPEPAVDEVIEDSMILGAAQEPQPAAIMAPRQQPARSVAPGPTTPRRSARISQMQAQETPTSKSDGEEFVDAPTSPLPKTPTRQNEAARNSTTLADPPLAQPPAYPIPTDSTTSFDGGINDSALLELMGEMDANGPEGADHPPVSASASPEKREVSPVAECIVVKESPSKKKKQPAPVLSRKTRSSSAAASPVKSPVKLAAEPVVPFRVTRSSSMASPLKAIAEPPAEELPSAPSSQRRTRGGRGQKRKRTTSKAQESSPKRLCRNDSQISNATADRQELPSQTGDVEVADSGEMKFAFAPENLDGESPEERIPSSSAELAAPQSTGEGASQEVAAAGDDTAMEVESDHDVQSQIALEFSHSCRQDITGEDPASQSSVEEAMAVDLPADVAQTTTNDPEDKEQSQPALVTADVVGEMTTTIVEDTTTTTPSPPPPASAEASQAQKILDLFRSGLDELRTARLSREDVYKIEDVFMDLRKELIEAERRARASM